MIALAVEWMECKPILNSCSPPDEQFDNEDHAEADGQLGVRLVQQVGHRKTALKTKQLNIHWHLMKLLHCSSELLGIYQSMDQDMLHFISSEILHRQAQLDMVR